MPKKKTKSKTIPLLAIAGVIISLLALTLFGVGTAGVKVAGTIAPEPSNNYPLYLSLMGVLIGAMGIRYAMTYPRKYAFRSHMASYTASFLGLSSIFLTLLG